MEPLTWTGALGTYFVPVLQIGIVAVVVGIIGSFTAVFASSTQPVFAPGGAVISPWKPTTASSLAELILPGALTGIVLFIVEYFWGGETTLASWFASSGMPAWTVWLLTALSFFLVGALIAWVLQRMPASAYEMLTFWAGTIVIAAILLFIVLAQFTSFGGAGIAGEMARQFLPRRFDPPDFALTLARKDVGLAVALGRELDVPMRLANMTLEEMTEAMNRGWGDRDSRTAMLLQEERAGVEVTIAPDRLDAILEQD